MKLPSFTALLWALCAGPAVAFEIPPHLVKDINTAPEGVPAPEVTILLNGKFLFAFTDTHHGSELWRADSAGNGAVMLRDLAPGAAGSSPAGFSVLGGICYFSADDGVNGRELWRTDGTSEGTWLVKDIRQGAAGSAPASLAVLGTSVYFSADDGTAGRELWRSDGTAAGTVLLKDIEPAEESGDPQSLTVYAGRIYFSAAAGTSGRELWRTDGTPAGTVLAKDTTTGPLAGTPRQLTVAGSLLYFTASNGSDGEELWKSDGTTGGTSQVKNILSGSLSSAPYLLTPVGSTLYFVANDGTNGYELWKSNGTSAGTVLVRDLTSGGSETYGGMTGNGNTLYIYLRSTIGTGTPQALWKSDGTFAGTVAVRQFAGSGGVQMPDHMLAAGGTVYLFADDDVPGLQLWKTNGTAAGTVHVTSSAPDAPAGASRFIGSAGAWIYFWGRAGNGGQGIWKTDGTSILPVTSPLPEPTRSSSPVSLTPFGDKVFFAAEGNGSGIEPWISDGTPAGTLQLADTYPGPRGSDPVKGWAVGKRVFFIAFDGFSSSSLWVTDGTPAGTRRLKNGDEIFAASSITVVGERLFFRGSGRLWVSDGTPEGTVPVAGPWGGLTSLSQGGGAAGNLFIFEADDGEHGKELWRSDGTASGTIMVKDIYTGGASSPTSFFSDGTRVYFNAKANGDGSSTGFWRTDGTEAGTVRLATVGASAYVRMGGLTYFAGASNAWELWKTDGTPTGTGLVADPDPVGHAEPRDLTVFGDRLLYSSKYSGYGREPWLSDGTAGGTQLLKDCLPGAAASNPGYFAVAGQRAFFDATNSNNNSVIWTSTGFPEGTRVFFPYATRPMAVGGKLFFIGSAAGRGAELYVYDAAQVDDEEDGLPDAWEMEHFSSTAPDGAEDSDADGQSNAAEFLTGHNPASAADFLHLDFVSSSQEVSRFVIDRVQAGCLYVIERAVTPDAAVWEEVDQLTVPLEVAPLPVAVPGSGGRWFYRLRVSPLP